MLHFLITLTDNHGLRIERRFMRAIPAWTKDLTGQVDYFIGEVKFVHVAILRCI